MEAGAPVRDVDYGTARIFAPVPPALSAVAALPPSPRAAMDEMTIEATKPTNPLLPHARQPSIAMDKDGNAVVVWRDNFKDIMAIGIDNTNAVTFGPTKINDQACVSVAVLRPGPVPPDLVCEEDALEQTYRPVVARAADGAFAVVWGTVVTCSDGGWIPFLCGRVMNADGKTASSPPAFISREVEEFTYVDVAIDSSHNFLATWFDIDGSNERVRAQRFDAYGNPTHAGATPLVVSDQSSFDALWPTVAMSRDGRATIAWLRRHLDAASNTYVTDDVRFQRFNSDFTKLGDVISVGAGLSGQGSFAGIPDVAMNPSSGRISLVGRTDPGTIWDAVYDFDQGTSIYAPMQVNARATGKMRRPAVAATNSGDIMVAWLDDVGSGSAEVMPISAQVYSGDGLPLDVDFTASTQTLPETGGMVDCPDPNNPSRTDSCFLNPDFMVEDAFAFQLAASDHDYALTWQTSNGIAVQRLTGGRFACPQPSGGSCGNSVPIRVNGSAAQNIDIVFLPGLTIDEDDGSNGIWSNWYNTEGEFARVAVGLAVNGYFANDFMRGNQSSFNLYYDYVDFGTLGLSKDDRSGLYALDDYPSAVSSHADTATEALANVKVIVMKDLYRFEKYPMSAQIDLMPNSGETVAMLPISGAGVCVIYGDDDYNIFLHESGHAIFGLRDERSCDDPNQPIPDDRFDDTIPHPNVFRSGPLCQLNSSHPADCDPIDNCKDSGLWKADGNDGARENQGHFCIMAGQNGHYNSVVGDIQYDLDCQRRANDIIAQPWK